MNFFMRKCSSYSKTLAVRHLVRGTGSPRGPKNPSSGGQKPPFSFTFTVKRKKSLFTFFDFFAKSVKYDSVYKQKGNPGARHDRAEGAFFETCKRFLLLFTFAKVAISRTQNDQFPIGNIDISEFL